MTETKDRSEVAERDKWKVEALYPGLTAWQDEFEEVCRPKETPHWPELATYKGRLGEGAETLHKFFTLSFELDRKLSKLYTYAHMRYDEDLGNDLFKKAYGEIITFYHDFQQEVAFAEPEILALDHEVLDGYFKDDRLKEYHFHLEEVIRLKPHTLDGEQEELLAMASKSLGTSSLAYNAFNNADIKFPSIRDSRGNPLELTHGKYLLYMRSLDRTVRQQAFYSLYKVYSSFENTICELLSGHVQAHLFNAKARKFKGCLEASLFPNEIDTKVYTNLIETARDHLDVLHRYMGLRKKAMGLDAMHLYDLYVPIVKNVRFEFDYEDAEQLVIDSVAPLGEEYQAVLSKGLKLERWVDRFENLRKRSGAYSTGCYDSKPYILMNFNGQFHDLMTLAHEAGHSMHSHLSRENQPYQYSHYPIFLAEVASTFNEELMFEHLMKQDLTKGQKAFLINQKIEDIRSTFFRQIMFAEFELHIHRLAEEKIPLTPTLLKDYFYKLNVDYLGPEVEIDPEIDMEWGRIPHFYSNFYVYQYATGISAAHALFAKVKQEGASAKEKYLRFLSSGSSQYPLDLLKEAGVNMVEKQPIVSTIDHFSSLVEQLASLMV